MLREQKRKTNPEDGGDKDGEQRSFRQGHLRVGAEPFAIDDMSREIEKEVIVVDGRADAVDRLAGGQP